MKLLNLRAAKNQPSLQAIIEGCKKQEPRSQELLFRCFAPRILTTCRRYESSHFGAKDILQETFITIFEKVNQFDSQKGTIESWMKKIAINTALKILRKQKMKWIEVDQIPDHPEQTEEEITRIPEEKILEILESLPKGYRTVFNLFIIDGYSHQEIADLLGISLATSKSQLFKAKKMMREKLKPFKKTLIKY